MRIRLTLHIVREDHKAAPNVVGHKKEVIGKSFGVMERRTQTS